MEVVRIEQDPVRVAVAVQFHGRFKFNKRAELFVGVHNEPLSVAAMCIGQSRLFALLASQDRARM